MIIDSMPLHDHKIVGGCSTLPAKSNKKNAFFATKVLCISKKSSTSDICLPSAFPRSYVRVLRGIRK